MILFTTFASKNMSVVAERIKKEALDTGIFDKALSIDEEGLTSELLASDTFKIKKGFGYYSWKPDTIWQTLQKANDGDIIVYCDAGCTLQNSREWNVFFTLLEKYSILGFRIVQKNYLWTRISVFEHFQNQIKTDWKNLFQFGANAIIIKKSKDSVSFISEWRDYMINRLDLCGDVVIEHKNLEDPRFIENRYDQTIMTALLYKYKEKGSAVHIWENFEGYNIFKKQAIIATRNRVGRNPNDYKSIKHIAWRSFKNIILYPFYSLKYKL